MLSRRNFLLSLNNWRKKMGRALSNTGMVCMMCSFLLILWIMLYAWRTGHAGVLSQREFWIKNFNHGPWHFGSVLFDPTGQTKVLKEGLLAVFMLQGASVVVLFLGMILRLTWRSVFIYLLSQVLLYLSAEYLYWLVD
jgi:hypothetical protein